MEGILYEKADTHLHCEMKSTVLIHIFNRIEYCIFLVMSV